MSAVLQGTGDFFKKIGQWIKQHKKLFIILVSVLLLAAIGLGIFLWLASGVQTSAASMPDVTALQKMDLEQTVTATGTLQSANTKQVTSSLSYEVSEVFVDVGDTVTQGQILCQLDTTELDKSIAEANANIAEAVASDKLALEQAERKLQDAINTRTINWNANVAAVNTAQSALNTANNTLSAANSKLASAQTTASNCAADVTNAQTNFNTWKAANPTEPDASNPYTLAVQNAQTASDAAATALAAAQKEQGEAATAASAAQSTYNKAVETRDTTYRNDSLSVENAQDSVNNQKLKDSAKQYRTQLEQYQEDKENCTITAPISGTVTARTATVGSAAGGGAAAAGTGTSSTSSGLFTIEDLTSLEVPASVAEYDVANISPGMSVHITSDAYEDETWEGTVSSISPIATDTSGNFTVTVKLTSPVGSLTAGNSAKLNIVVESKKDVYAVPYDAVTTNAAGQSVIYVMADAGMAGGTGGRNGTPPDLSGAGSMSIGGGMPMQTPPAGMAQGNTDDTSSAINWTEIEVTTGMETDYYIEISSAELQEGMLVWNNPTGSTQPTSEDMQNGAGFMMMGGGGGNGGGDFGGGGGGPTGGPV